MKTKEIDVSAGVTGATEFFGSLYKGKELAPIETFRGLKLQNASPEELICDCCGDGNDCCGFN